MNKVLFVDSDVILDVLEQRKEFYEYSALILSLGDEKKVKLVTTSLVFANVYYDTMYEEDKNIKTKLSNYEQLVDELTKNTDYLDKLCSSSNRSFDDLKTKCSKYKITRFFAFYLVISYQYDIFIWWM